MKIFDTSSADTIDVELPKKTKLTLKQGKVTEGVTLTKGRHSIPLSKFKPGIILIATQGNSKTKSQTFSYIKPAVFEPAITMVSKGRVNQLMVGIPPEAKVNVLGYNAVFMDEAGNRLSRYSSPPSTVPYLIPMELPDDFKGIVNVRLTTRTRTGAVRSEHQLTV